MYNRFSVKKCLIAYTVISCFLSMTFIACGDDVTSAQSETMTDPRDGQVYNVVTIGSQTWMAENLNFETGSSFCYNNEESDCTKYGRLYKWAAATTACPEGWHLPTKAEFETLFTAVGGQLMAGKVLKSISGWYNSGNGTDAFGFSALPAGFGYDDGDLIDEGYSACFWSSTEDGSYYAYNMELYFLNVNANLFKNYKDNGFSVRCLRD